jgi:hypothetical protein
MIERMSAFLGSQSVAEVFKLHRILAGKLWFVVEQHSLPFRTVRGSLNPAEQKHFDSRKVKWKLEMNKEHGITS